MSSIENLIVATQAALEPDRRIRERYRELLPQIGQQQAFMEIGEAFYISERQVRRIVYEQR